MFDEAFDLLILVLGFGAIAIVLAAGLFTAIMNHFRVCRALELRMEERLALVERGIHPQTLAPLPTPRSEEPPA